MAPSGQYWSPPAHPPRFRPNLMLRWWPVIPNLWRLSWPGPGQQVSRGRSWPRLTISGESVGADPWFGTRAWMSSRQGTARRWEPLPGCPMRVLTTGPGGLRRSTDWCGLRRMCCAAMVMPILDWLTGWCRRGLRAVGIGEIFSGTIPISGWGSSVEKGERCGRRSCRPGRIEKFRLVSSPFRFSNPASSRHPFRFYSTTSTGLLRNRRGMRMSTGCFVKSSGCEDVSSLRRRDSMAPCPVLSKLPGII